MGAKHSNWQLSQNNSICQLCPFVIGGQKFRVRVCVYGVTELFCYFLSSGGTIRAWTADTSHVVCSWVRVRIRVRVCVYGVTELFRYFLSSGGTIRAWTADTSHVVCSWVRVRIRVRVCVYGVTELFRYFLSSGGTIRAWTTDTSHVVCSCLHSQQFLYFLQRTIM